MVKNCEVWLFIEEDRLYVFVLLCTSLGDYDSKEWQLIEEMIGNSFLGSGNDYMVGSRAPDLEELLV